MKFFAIVASLLAAVPLIQAITVAYDPVYDKRANSMEIVACSDGENGLITQGKSAVAFSTLGRLYLDPNKSLSHRLSHVRSRSPIPEHRCSCRRC